MRLRTLGLCSLGIIVPSIIFLLTTLIVSIACGQSRSINAVVKIIHCGYDKRCITGSGTCISPDGLILTIDHVVEPLRTKLDVQFRHHGTFRVKSVQVWNAATDPDGPALLQIETTKPLPWLKIASTAPRIGERVFVMGYPRGQFRSFEDRVMRPQGVTRTYFAGPNGNDVDLLTIHNTVWYGGSGGPLVNVQWEVTGVASVSNRLPGRPGAKAVKVNGVSREAGGMFIHTKHIHEVLRNYEGRPVTTLRRTKTEKKKLPPQKYRRTQGLGIGIFGAQPRNRRPQITKDEVREIARAEAQNVVDVRVSAAVASLTEKQRELIGATDAQRELVNQANARIVENEKKQEDRDKEQDDDRKSLLSRLAARLPVPEKVKDVISLASVVSGGLATGGPIAAGLAAAGWFMRRKFTEVPKPKA